MLELTGNFLLDSVVLFLIFILPVPSTPYIIYIFASYTIFEAGVMFFLVSNIEHVFLYYVGFYSNLASRKGASLQAFNFSKGSLKAKTIDIYEKVKKFSKDRIENSTAFDIFVARWVGVHPIIVCLGMGRIKAKISPLLVANNIYVIKDILFYWALLSSGALLFNRFFPEMSIEDLLDTKYLYPLSIFFIILFYVIYGLYKWRSSRKVNERDKISSLKKKEENE